MSRQTRWQERKLAAGLCTLCGLKSQSRYCVLCREKRRLAARRRYGSAAWHPGGAGREPKAGAA